MKEYTLKEDEIAALKDILDVSNGHSAHYIRTEVIKNLLPGLFEPFFKVGKYYQYCNAESNYESYFKCMKIESGGVFGYGLDTQGFDNNTNNSQAWWVEEKDCKDTTEITKEEFLAKIMKYAEEKLGFREGVEFVNTIGESSTCEGKMEICTTMSSNEDDGIQFGEYNGLIFDNGEFGEVKEESKAFIMESCKVDRWGFVGNTEGQEDVIQIWQPTMELRWVEAKFLKELAGEYKLQQKWVSNTGDYKWEDIKTV